MKLRNWVWAACLAVSSSLSANVLKDDSLNSADFAQQAEEVRIGMQPGGAYHFLTDRQRIDVEADLKLINEILQPRQEGRAIHDEELVKLFNAQERVNAALTQREAKRTVCTRKKVLGSNIPTNECVSYGRHKLMTRAISDSDKMRFQQCRGPGCAAPQ